MVSSRPIPDRGSSQCTGKKYNHDRISGPAFVLTFWDGLLYLATAGTIPLVVAAAKDEETADENAYKSLPCNRTSRLTLPPRSISLVS